jgi:hypothetical protein
VCLTEGDAIDPIDLLKLLAGPGGGRESIRGLRARLPADAHATHGTPPRARLVGCTVDGVGTQCDRVRVRHRQALSIAAVVAAVMAAASLAARGSAAQLAYPSIGGPLWVRIGHQVTLDAVAFPPRRRLTLEIDLGRDAVGAHPCCLNVVRGPVTGANGSARVRFTFPRRYEVFPDRVWRPWTRFSIAIITITSEGWGNLKDPDLGRATKVVYLDA